MKEKSGSVTWACRNNIRKAKAQFVEMREEHQVFCNYSYRSM